MSDSDLDLGEVAKKRWDKIKAEKEEKKIDADRIEDVLEKRKEAVNVIRDYQEETGTPTDDEADMMFFSEAGINVDSEELKKQKEI
jgi:hypothetical protein